MIIKVTFMSKIIQTYLNTFKRATFRKKKKKKKIHKLKLLKTFFLVHTKYTNKYMIIIICNISKYNRVQLFSQNRLYYFTRENFVFVINN